MNLTPKFVFISQFFLFQDPIPFVTPFSQEQLRSNDMKICLQIATRSNLRMQSDTKTSLVSFSCKNYGKSCFQMFAFKKEGNYFVETNYRKMNHQKNCQLQSQNFEYLKIYNLMKLKKQLIESFMQKHDLLNSSPSEILSQISEAEEYFFQEHIQYNSQMRRKLRKRFDNIVNIDIKKITKGGREDPNGRDLEDSQYDNKSFKQYKYLNFSTKLKNCVIENEQYESSTSFFDGANSKHAYKQKNKHIKKNKKQRKNRLEICPIKNKQKESEKGRVEKKEQFALRNPLSHQQFYEDAQISAASQSELEQIKQLNERYTPYEHIFSSQPTEFCEFIRQQTINDKLRESMLFSIRKNFTNKKEINLQSFEDLPSKFNEASSCYDLSNELPFDEFI